MKQFWIAAMLVCAGVGATALAQDKVIVVPDEDQEMEEAIGKAQKTLPHFWERLASPAPNESGFALKVPLEDEEGVEYFWLNQIERRDGLVHGTIGNTPNIVKYVKEGQRISFPKSDIADWFYMRDRKMVGNETLRPLIKRMSPAQAARYRSILANP